MNYGSVSYNLEAQLADNLDFYRQFTQSRSSVSYPEKSQVPLVWDLYLGGAGQGAGELAPPAAAGPGQPLESPAPQPEAAPWMGEAELAGEGRGPAGPAQRPAKDPGPPLPPPHHQ